jgi:hypothetical protein
MTCGAFHIEGILRAHIKPFPLTTIHLLVVEKDIQPPFWSPIPSFGVLLSQPAPSGARLHHFYFSSFIARRYFIVPGVNGIPHRQKNQIGIYTILLFTTRLDRLCNPLGLLTVHILIILKVISFFWRRCRRVSDCRASATFSWHQRC